MKRLKRALLVVMVAFIAVVSPVILRADESGYTLSKDTSDYSIEFVNASSEFIYTGKECKPDIRLVYTDSITEEEHELDASLYVVNYSNNINCGTATVSASLTVDDEELIISKDFDIQKASISSATAKLSKSVYSYTGKDIKPAVSVYLGTVKLIKGTDYQVTYANNKEIGKATVKITGTGNYKGTLTQRFSIKLASPSVSVTTAYQKNNFKWKKITGASGYQVWRSKTKNGTYEKCANITATSYANSVKLNSTYYYKVRAYKKVGTKYVYSDFTPARKVLNRLETPTIYNCDRMTETSINIAFNKIAGADGYYIYKSTKKDGKYTKIATYKSSRRWAYLDEKCKENTKYYYKVVAYRKVNGTVYRSVASAPFEGELWKNSIMHYLFPDGVPKTERAMQKYLTTVRVVMIDAKGKKTYRSLTIHKKLAKKVKAIFQEMADAGIAVRRSDTGSYNWRKMTTCNLQSHHSYGCVVDLNWGANPFVRLGGNAYNSGYRPGKDPYSITSKTVKIWAKYGFKWGGDWKTYKDYMHFTYTNH